MDKKKEFDYILAFIEDGDFIRFDEVKQLRALWTAFCLHHELAPDTRAYDCYALKMWNHLQEGLTCPWSRKRFDDFDLFMGALLC